MFLWPRSFSPLHRHCVQHWTSSWLKDCSKVTHDYTYMNVIITNVLMNIVSMKLRQQDCVHPSVEGTSSPQAMLS